MKLRCIIVDDCPIQRAMVHKLVCNNSNLTLIGEFSNAVETKNFLSYTTVDLLFLDIEMPILNGFDFLDILKIKPQVIFITAKSDYAVKAFDYEATDYIQKPITHPRFKLAVIKALKKQLLLNEPSSDDVDYIFIKCNLKNLKVFTSKINYLEAYGDYVKVITDHENH